MDKEMKSVEFVKETIPQKWEVKIDGIWRNLNLVANFGTRLPETVDAMAAIGEALEQFSAAEKFVLLARTLQDLLRGEL